MAISLFMRHYGWSGIRTAARKYNSTWSNLSVSLVEDFIEFYPFSKKVLTIVEKCAGIECDEIKSGYVDHVTMNLATKEQAELVGRTLNSCGLEQTKQLVFKENYIDGQLFWLAHDEPAFRPLTTKGACKGVQGIFLRYLQPTFLEELHMSSNMFSVPPYIDAKDLLQFLHQCKLESSKVNWDILRKDARKVLKNHLRNGYYGHVAFDVLAMGTTINSVKSAVQDSTEVFVEEDLGNPENTIRQYYLSDPCQEKDGEGEVEPFVELIEREVIDSVSAVKSVAV